MGTRQRRSTGQVAWVTGAGSARTLPIASPVTVSFTPRPLPLLYVRGLALGLRRQQGQMPPGAAGFPGLVVEQHGVRMARARVAAWQIVCGDATPSACDTGEAHLAGRAVSGEDGTSRPR